MSQDFRFDRMFPSLQHKWVKLCPECDGNYKDDFSIAVITDYIKDYCLDREVTFKIIDDVLMDMVGKYPDEYDECIELADKIKKKLIEFKERIEKNGF